MPVTVMPDTVMPTTESVLERVDLLALIPPLHHSPAPPAAPNNLDSNQEIHNSTTLLREVLKSLERVTKASVLGDVVSSITPSSRSELFGTIAERINQNPLLSRYLNLSSGFSDFLRVAEVATSPDPTQEAIIQVATVITGMLITSKLAMAAASACGFATAGIAPPIGPAAAAFTCAAGVGFTVHIIVEELVKIVVNATIEKFPSPGEKKHELNLLITDLFGNIFPVLEAIDLQPSNFNNLSDASDTLYDAASLINQQNRAYEYQVEAARIMNTLWNGAFDPKLIFDPKELLSQLKLLHLQIDLLLSLEKDLGKEPIIGALQILYWNMVFGKELPENIFSNIENSENPNPNPKDYGVALLSWFTKEVVNATTDKVLMLSESLNEYSPTDEGYEKYLMYVNGTVDKYIEEGLIQPSN